MLLWGIWLTVKVLIVLMILGISNAVVEDDQAVFVKINPFISKSKTILEFKGDGRFKRGDDSSDSLFLEFPKSFFSDPKLKSLYAHLIGGSPNGKAPKSTKIVFQLDPTKINGNSKIDQKREASKDFDDKARFQLKIGGAVHRKPPNLHDFTPRVVNKNWCMEIRPETTTIPSTVGQKEFGPVYPTLCYPTKFESTGLRVCGLTTKPVILKPKYDPCVCSTEPTAPEKSTEYIACKSSPPVVSQNLDDINWTTEPCKASTCFRAYAADIFNTTVHPSKPSCPDNCDGLQTPPCPQKCSPGCPTPCPTCPYIRQSRVNGPLKTFFRQFRPKQNAKSPESPPYRRVRKVWIYKPKRGLRKVYLRKPQQRLNENL